jgi:hypothetical protein
MGKNHNQMGHILVNKRRHWNLLDVPSFRTADFYSYHHLVVAKVGERLAVKKQRSHRFHIERFNVKKLKEVDGKEMYRIQV